MFRDCIHLREPFWLEHDQRGGDMVRLVRPIPEICHVHTYQSKTSCCHGHLHCMAGTSSYGELGRGTHVHEFGGVTTCNNGHVHYYKGMTGPAIPLGNGEHTHCFEGVTTCDAEHAHFFQGKDNPSCNPSCL